MYNFTEDVLFKMNEKRKTIKKNGNQEYTSPPKRNKKETHLQHDSNAFNCDVSFDSDDDSNGNVTIMTQQNDALTEDVLSLTSQNDARTKAKNELTCSKLKDTMSKTNNNTSDQEKFVATNNALPTASVAVPQQDCQTKEDHNHPSKTSSKKLSSESNVSADNLLLALEMQQGDCNIDSLFEIHDSDFDFFRFSYVNEHTNQRQIFEGIPNLGVGDCLFESLIDSKVINIDRFAYKKDHKNIKKEKDFDKIPAYHILRTDFIFKFRKMYFGLGKKQYPRENAKKSGTTYLQRQRNKDETFIGIVDDLVSAIQPFGNTDGQKDYSDLKEFLDKTEQLHHDAIDMCIWFISLIYKIEIIVFKPTTGVMYVVESAHEGLKMMSKKYTVDKSELVGCAYIYFHDYRYPLDNYCSPKGTIAPFHYICLRPTDSLGNDKFGRQRKQFEFPWRYNFEEEVINGCQSYTEMILSLLRKKPVHALNKNDHEVPFDETEENEKALSNSVCINSTSSLFGPSGGTIIDKDMLDSNSNFMDSGPIDILGLSDNKSIDNKEVELPPQAQEQLHEGQLSHKSYALIGKEIFVCEKTKNQNYNMSLSNINKNQDETNRNPNAETPHTTFDTIRPSGTMPGQLTQDRNLNNSKSLVLLEAVGMKSRSTIANEPTLSKSGYREEEAETIDGIKHFHMTYKNNSRIIGSMKIEYRTGEKNKSQNWWYRSEHKHKNRKRGRNKARKISSENFCKEFYHHLGLHEKLKSIGYLVKFIDTGRNTNQIFDGNVFCLGKNDMTYPWRIAATGTEVDIYVSTKDMVEFIDTTKRKEKLVGVEIGRACFEERRMERNHKDDKKDGM